MSSRGRKLSFRASRAGPNPARSWWVASSVGGRPWWGSTAALGQRQWLTRLVGLFLLKRALIRGYGYPHSHYADSSPWAHRQPKEVGWWWGQEPLQCRVNSPHRHCGGSCRICQGRQGVAAVDCCHFLAQSLGTGLLSPSPTTAPEMLVGIS